jgi:hypothetical protein
MWLQYADSISDLHAICFTIFLSNTWAHLSTFAQTYIFPNCPPNVCTNNAAISLANH